jgi:predicted lipoprotein with Yx(FWY)xxD motif
MRRIPLLFAVLAVSFAACGGNDDTASGPGSSPEEQGGLTISMATTDFGPALVAPEGKLLYMFVPDQHENGTPTCYADCE